MKKLQIFLVFAFVFLAYSVNYYKNTKLIAIKENLSTVNDPFIAKEHQDADHELSLAETNQGLPIRTTHAAVTSTSTYSTANALNC